MPGGVRSAVIFAVLFALSGALVLIALRGDALLVDLALLQRSFCF
jgi:hypothetical protein